MVNWAIHEGIMIALYSIGGENCEAEADIELYKTRHLPNKHTTQDLAPYELESYKNAWIDKNIVIMSYSNISSSLTWCYLPTELFSTFIIF